MRAIWSGAIGFGLVNIPVKLFSATQQAELDLDMLDKKDHANIKYQRVNGNTGKEVDWDDIVKGYKVEDEYVVLNEKDFEKASPEKTKIIEIAEFVNEKDIDSIYYETPYYLQPEKSGGKPYALLRDALKKTGKAGLGTYVLRNRESLVLIKAAGNMLILNKIRFQDEIREADELDIPDVKIKPAEMAMAVQLIEQLTTEFDISNYKDTYTESLLKLIMDKAKGKKPTTPKMKIVHSKSKDLMAQLKESLSAPKRKAS
ncbi:Ku protein [Dyadobacter chenwenxiniae]|uniref:Non-homologous end joining protein Ku n=1 Tax=Dyadobacter chenwenxiniae TaxID=2906456 RepID=A0A9X1PMG2_9BACT|nr:Ku protein [Dyadobacter chenwenxiniae]MCF0064022.1 Ku protein [Dyadobacter chenwenxiniae]UON82749.1 Ku protein [Dyadobacter chenwenxiniae]